MNNNSVCALKIIERFCEYSGCEIYRGYSGRGMYGKKCVGFVSSDIWNDLMKFGAFFRDESALPVEMMFGSARVDNMGLDTIVYFPIVDDSDYEEPEDEEE